LCNTQNFILFFNLVRKLNVNISKFVYNFIMSKILLDQVLLFLSLYSVFYSVVNVIYINYYMYLFKNIWVSNFIRYFMQSFGVLNKYVHLVFYSSCYLYIPICYSKVFSHQLIRKWRWLQRLSNSFAVCLYIHTSIHPFIHSSFQAVYKMPPTFSNFPRTKGRKEGWREGRREGRMRRACAGRGLSV